MISTVHILLGDSSPEPEQGPLYTAHSLFISPFGGGLTLGLMQKYQYPTTIGSSPSNTHTSHLILQYGTVFRNLSTGSLMKTWAYPCRAKQQIHIMSPPNFLANDPTAHIIFRFPNPPFPPLFRSATKSKESHFL